MSPANREQVLADLRRTHAQLKADASRPNLDGSANVRQWSMRLTLEEVDVLLDIVDERDELRRRLCDDFEGTHTGDPIGREEREAPPTCTCGMLEGAPYHSPGCALTLGREERETPPHADLFDQDAPPPLALRVEGFTTEYATCYLCDGHLVRYGAGEWQHTVNVRAAHAGIPAADESKPNA